MVVLALPTLTGPELMAPVLAASVKTTVPVAMPSIDPEAALPPATEASRAI